MSPLNDLFDAIKALDLQRAQRALDVLDAQTKTQRLFRDFECSPVQAVLLACYPSSRWAPQVPNSAQAEVFLRLLLNAGMPPDATGRAECQSITPLAMAAIHGLEVPTRILLEHNASPDIFCGLKGLVDEYALHTNNPRLLDEEASTQDIPWSAVGTLRHLLRDDRIMPSHKMADLVESMSPPRPVTSMVGSWVWACSLFEDEYGEYKTQSDDMDEYVVVELHEDGHFICTTDSSESLTGTWSTQHPGLVFAWDRPEHCDVLAIEYVSGTIPDCIPFPHEGIMVELDCSAYAADSNINAHFLVLMRQDAFRLLR